MKRIQYRAHRGVAAYAPENTLPAFQMAMEQGVDYIETDPQFTKDGVIVLMHDSTVNRTCRNEDGSEITQSLQICDLTYEQLLELDAGIWKGEQFRGTKIPTLDQLLALAEGTDVIIELDKKIKTEEMDALFDTVSKYNTKVAFFCADVERIQKVQSRFPDARIVYEGVMTDEALQAVTGLVRPENLTLWVYLDKPNFHWLEPLRKTSPEICARVKKYGRLGIGNINHTFDVREALQYEPDLIEL